MTMHPFDLSVAHPTWKDCLQRGISKLNPEYLRELSLSTDWLPGPQNIFNAFSLPLNKVNYVLFGESPYPRRESANGFAFWDASVDELWYDSGLSKKVNRATSLRNIIKMLLIAEGAIDKNNSSQPAIAQVNKQDFIQTNDALFNNLINHGFLLLNATPILRASAPQKDARAFYPFTQELLDCLLQHRPQVKFLLLGRIANTIDNMLPAIDIEKLYAEHPYNLSFITNQKVIDFFKPLHLLRS